MSGLATLERTEQAVAKKKPTQARNDEAVRIRSDVAAKARVAAAYLGISITEYVSNVVGAVVDKDIEEGYVRLRKAPSKARKPTE